MYEKTVPILKCIQGISLHIYKKKPISIILHDICGECLDPVFTELTYEDICKLKVFADEVFKGE